MENHNLKWMMWGGHHHFRKPSYIASPQKKMPKLGKHHQTCILEKLFGICLGGYEKNWWYYYQWPFQEPKLEVPTIYKAYVREYPHKIWPYMVQYLQFRILEFPLIL